MAGTPILDCLIDHYNKNIGIFILAHTIDHIITDITSFVTHFYIFRHEASIDHIKRKAGNPKTYIECSNLVRKFTNKHHTILEKAFVRGKTIWRKVEIKEIVNDPIYPHIIFMPKENLYQNNLTKSLKSL